LVQGEACRPVASPSASGAEAAYARKLGVKLKQPATGDIAAIAELRDAVAAVLGGTFAGFDHAALGLGPQPLALLVSQPPRTDRLCHRSSRPLDSH
jgi:hypothetical protein